MGSYLYRPEHPFANGNGFVDKSIYLQGEYYKKEHLNMTVGNQKVYVQYISDNLDYVRHMSNGKIYTSKKKFRDETKARGCIEVGNEIKIKPRKQIVPDRRQRREDIKKAISQVRNGQVPKF